jgi:hypothetical protein
MSALFGLLYQPRMTNDVCGAAREMRADKENRSTWRKPTPMSLNHISLIT